MRLQPKSLISALAPARAAAADVASAPPTPNLQALAAELQQSALEGVFEYPRNWLLVTKVAATLLLALSWFHVAMVTLSIVRSPRFQPNLLANWSLVGALIGAALAMFTAALLLNLFATIKVTPQGLGISELFGWRRVPWSQVEVLKVMEVSSKGRYVVLAPFRGPTSPRTPAPMLKLIPALTGVAGRGQQGVLLTSDIKNFDRLVQLILSYMSQAAGQSVPAIEAFIDEAAIMPVVQLLLDPEAALVRLARRANMQLSDYGLETPVDDEPVLPWPKVMTRQLLIALPPAFCLLIDALVQSGGRPLLPVQLVSTLLLLVLGLVELPFMAKLVQAVGDLMVGSGQFKRSTWAYLELQAPRALLVLLGAALLGAGVPTAIPQLLWLAGIFITTFLTTRFVQRLYYLTLTQAMLASIGTFVFQLSLFALYLGAR